VHSSLFGAHSWSVEVGMYVLCAGLHLYVANAVLPEL